MANALYDLGRQKFLEGAIAWLTDDIKLVLVDGADYTQNLATDEFIDDIPGAAVEATSSNFVGKTSTIGVADATDVTLTAVTGDECELIAVYHDTGTPATSPLIALYDTATNLPVTPNGGDIVIQWDSGSNRMFKL